MRLVSTVIAALALAAIELWIDREFNRWERARAAEGWR